MLKNQNGYPDSVCICAEKCNMGCGENTNGNSMTAREAVNALGGAPLAYVYSPNQPFRLLYSAKDALAHGTLFEELYKPMEVYGNE